MLKHLSNQVMEYDFTKELLYKIKLFYFPN